MADVGLPPLPPPGREAERDFLPLRGYALIGDCHGASLVGRDGSIDWCCFDRFDADPVFARLLDRRRGGFSMLRPSGAARVVRRRYQDASGVLETIFETRGGRVALTDLMPIAAGGPGGAGPAGWIVRVAEGLDGTVPMRAAHRPVRGLEAPLPELRVGTGSVSAEGCPTLHADLPFVPRREVAAAEFTLSAGERRVFVLAPEGHAVSDPAAAATRLVEGTRAFWRGWAAGIAYAGRYGEAVRRSAAVLKMLTYHPTGAIVAAPTASLPEEIGGVRNWDYRFCWPRDACFALYALKKLGLTSETERFFRFLLRAAGDTLPRVPPLFPVDGGDPSGLRERVVAGAEGYMGSRPVRLGNEAVEQHQLDVYGQLLDLMHFHANVSGGLGPEVERVGIALADHVAAHWREPDHGIWEPRLPPRRHGHSAMMAWVALDRALALFGPNPRWRAERDAVLADIRALGTHPQGGHLTQVLGGEAPDAALLLAPMVGLPIPDGTLERTVDTVIARLGQGPLVWRYRGEDGLPGEEGSFLVCAFWLVDALLALGRGAEARERFEALLALGNDLGLYPEEMAADGTFLGNFPQGFTHLGLAQSALLLELFETGGAAAVRGTHADRGLRVHGSEAAPPARR